MSDTPPEIERLRAAAHRRPDELVPVEEAEDAVWDVITRMNEEPAPLNVGAEPGESVGRAVIDGCVVTYDLDAPPRWLALLLADRDEDGNTDEFAPKRISDLEAAWGLISNAWNGNWEDAPVEWQEAAKRWRDEAWHPALDGSSRAR